MSRIEIPELALVLLVGPSGAGKTSFCRKHFLPTEVVSSDRCRAMVSDDENSQAATEDAFQLLYYIIEKRLKRGRFTVVDATNVQPEARKPLVELAKKYHAFSAAIVLNLPADVCIRRNQERTDRKGPFDYVERQVRQLTKSVNKLDKEGIRYIFRYDTAEAIDALSILKQPLWTNRRSDRGPFDIIGDIHGCYDELVLLLRKLGYEPETGRSGAGTSAPQPIFKHPAGRRPIFLGDLVDRGPRIVDTLALVMAMTKAGEALCVPGNHEVKLLKYLDGQKVKTTHGLEESIRELASAPKAFIQDLRDFLRSLVSHYVLDEGRLVVAHAGLSEDLQGRTSGFVRSFALYGQTTGETDAYGLPVRYPWAVDYRGSAAVVYGHTPVPEAEWLNNTLCIDTGCVYGGKLTALRWPEKEMVSVAAQRMYYEPLRPMDFSPPEAKSLTEQQVVDAVLSLSDVTGRQLIETRLHGRLSIKEDAAAAALEAMSRFAVDPRWLMYLPPTMSPSETSHLADYLEHPQEAFAYYAKRAVKTVVCQEKHMGSRGLLVLCRDDSVARRRFGITTGEIGKLYSRRGRPLIQDTKMEQDLLGRMAAMFDKSGLWQELKSDWVLLDGELLPWSFKAEELIKKQYAAVGSAGKMMLTAATRSLEGQRGRHAELDLLLDAFQSRLECVTRYTDVYGRYSWEVQSISDLKYAPFHVLASEGHVHVDKPHDWHMAQLSLLCMAGSDLFKTTQHLTVNPQDEADVKKALSWWLTLTEAGGEGMVVKPLDFFSFHQSQLIQPALKVRGREYLRLIYGPEYTLEIHLQRLRSRSLGVKRSLALRETALGVEALERFIRREPLRKVHQCVFGILALESEEVDARL